MAITVLLLFSCCWSTIADAEVMKRGLHVPEQTGYLVEDLQLDPGYLYLPAGFEALNQLQSFGNLNFDATVDYEPALLAFNRVFAQEHYFSQAVFTSSLVAEARIYNLDPCFVVALMASNLQKGLSEEQLNLVSLYGQDDNSANLLGQLVQLGSTDKRALYSEHYVARYFVRYVNLLRELLADSGSLVALAWHLGFDELALRLKNERYRHFISDELKHIQIAFEAAELCRSGVKKGVASVSKAPRSLTSYGLVKPEAPSLIN